MGRLFSSASAVFSPRSKKAGNAPPPPTQPPPARVIPPPKHKAPAKQPNDENKKPGPEPEPEPEPQDDEALMQMLLEQDEEEWVDEDLGFVLPPLQTWLPGLTDYLYAEDLCRLLAVNHFTWQARLHHLSESEVLATVSGEDSRLVKVNGLDKLMRVPDEFVGAVHLVFKNTGKTLDADFWTHEEFEMVSNAGRVVILGGDVLGWKRLGELERLELNCVSNLTDVMPLTTVHSLRLRACRGVTDVKPLCQIPDLSIHDCRNIEGFGRLAGWHHQLTIGDAHSLTDVSPFQNVFNLNFAFCRQLSDVSSLTDVHTLDLSNTAVSNVEGLGHVHTLKLDRCHQLENVSPLGAVHHLSLRQCKCLTDVSALSGVYHLDLSDCDNIVQVDMLLDVHTLDIQDCGKLAKGQTKKLKRHVHTLKKGKRH